MRLTFVLVLLLTIHLSASVYSQQTKLSLSLSNVTIREVLDQIEEQSRFKFLLQDERLDINQKISLDFDQSNITEILDKVFTGQDVQYVITEKNLIIITPGNEENFQREGVAQNKNISGKVVDTGGQPLPGVTVVVKGTAIGTITDTNGNYSLSNVPENATFQFSFVGMKMQEVKAGGQTTIDVVLAEDAIRIDEVVAIGYGSMKKADLTGSVSTVSAGDMKNMPVSNPLTALKGKVAGMEIITNSGQPGAGMDVRIRGVNSWQSSTSPLYIIDGIISDGINNINPGDIENVSVLKDASSSAIYGARAANGVVLITTRRGSKKAPEISFHTYQGIQKESNLKLNLLNSGQWVELDRESYTNAEIPLPYTDADLVQFEGVDTDWLGVVSQTGRVQYYDVSVSGGSEKSTYFISSSYNKQDGIIIGTGADKLNIRFNSDHKIAGFIEFGNSLNLYNTNFHGFPNISGVAGAGAAGGINPYTRAIEKVPLSRAYEEDGSYGYTRNNSIEHNYIPPHVYTNEFKNKSNTYGVSGNMFLKVKIIDGLTFTPRVSFEYNDYSNSQFVPVVNIQGTEGNSKNSVSKYNSNTIHWTSDYMLNYETTINEVHHFSALAVYSQEENKNEYLSGIRYDTPNSEIQYLYAGDASTASNDNRYSDWSFVSYTGRVNYNYNDKYLLQATVRRDGSSRFGKDNRWGVFPSYSAAWRISNEDFFESLRNVVNHLKIRASIGTLGNANIGTYPSYATLSGASYILNEQIVPAYTLSSAVNSNIKWETSKKYDIGFDASLFDSKIDFGFDWFLSHTSDLLYAKPLPVSAGKTSNPTINGGEAENRGFELNLGFRGSRGEFSYEISGNFATYKNKVLKLEDSNNRTNGLEIGQPMWSFFGYKSLGIIKDEETLNNYPQKTRSALGDIWVADIDGYDDDGELTGEPDGKITEADRTFIGNKYPEFTYGLEGNFSYKQFSLQVSLSGVHGVDLNTSGLSYFSGLSTNTTTRVLDRWNGTKNPDGNMPRLTRSDPAGNSQMSSLWLSDASYLRVNNVNLSYSMPQRICSKLLMKNLDIYISAQNLYTFTKYPGQEVDVNDSGQFSRPNTKIPQPVTLTAGMKFTL